ncbi:P-loop containing nucleoside triphosphate hydrolase protein [Paraphysoderma sedebokerense]|nr:P-loop containing nucleoside triphosphate hydrolase protein [Paraphysoderma sedebokerense]
MDVDKEESENQQDADDTGDADNMDEDEVDPLDAFMLDVNQEVQRLNKEDIKRMKGQSVNGKKAIDVRDQSDQSDEEEDILAYAAKKLAKKKDLAVVDHSQIDYESFRKDFYIEPPEYEDLSAEDVAAMRDDLDGIKVAGQNCPKPVKKWSHCGLPNACYEVIKKLGYTAPTPIQCQAIPAIMSGRDVIGVAKTGSGKTIAFLLPMFRHIKDQRPIEPMEGPISIIMTPTRELAMQIYKEAHQFCKVLGLRAVCAYGGSPIKDQIADLKRGAEIIVCTPGRMIDLLCANSGRVTNLRRVTYLVLDEADRMFDMGFEPQVMKIVNNTRPDRQTVLFSATFPRQMEALARKILKRPLEISVGGKSVVCQDVAQQVEVREDSTKFVRLLEILGQWFEKEPDTRALIFVDRQDAADNMLTNLLRRGYPCMSLHGGKDQMDRASTISDFKAGIVPVLIATSIAARGLDVKGLNIVINYDCPNHMEDYVHRVGRTGRAGNKGTAYTFITPDQERYAPDILQALKQSKTPIPEELQKMTDKFREKVKTGEAQRASSGFGGKGLERLDAERDIKLKVQKLAHGVVDEEESEEDGEGEGDVEDLKAKVVVPEKKDETVVPEQVQKKIESAASESKKIAEEVGRVVSVVCCLVWPRAADVIAQINQKLKREAATAETDESVYNHTYEFEINDYPQKARWKVTNKEQIVQICEITGAAITTRGTYYGPGKNPAPGDRKLYLYVEGDSQLVVDKAKAEIKRILHEATLSSLEQDLKSGVGRYSVV